MNGKNIKKAIVLERVEEGRILLGTDKQEERKLAGPLAKKELRAEECSRRNGKGEECSSRRRYQAIDKIKNAVMLERVGEGRIMLELIRKRKGNWLGHWLRRNCLLKDALEQGCQPFSSRANLHLSYNPAGRSHCRLQNRHGHIKHHHRGMGSLPGDIGEVPMT